MSCTICLRDDFTNYRGKDISWSYEGYSTTQEGEYTKDPECWLEFDGVDDYVEARNSSDLDFVLPIKVKFTHLTNDTYRPIVKSEAAGSPSRYWLIYTGGSFGLRTTDKNYDAPVNFTIGETYEYEVYQDGGDVVQTIDGVEYSRTAAGSLPVSSSYTFRLAAYETTGGQPTLPTENKIYSFQIGTETFPMNEGSGTTITGSEGTILDINGATWGCDEDFPDFDESCMDGPNPCFDSSELTPGFYKFTYTKGEETGDVYLYVAGAEDAGNPVGNAYCYQGLPFEDEDATVLDLEDFFVGATQYNIVYQGGELDQFDGQNLEISSLPAGEYCFTNVAEKVLPEGWSYEECQNCNDYESTCISIVEPLNAGDNRVIEVCNNVDEIFYADYLINNDGVGEFQVLEDNLTAGSLDSEKYEPDLTDVGDTFKIVHLLPSPLAANCVGSAILEFHVIDCVPPPVCADDSGLGIDIVEETNGSPSDAQFEDMLTITKTGTYDDAGVIATDGIYFSNDDGDNWTELTEVSGEYFVKDDDYWVKLSATWSNTCTSYLMDDITLSNGADVQEGSIISRAGTYNQNFTEIEDTDSMEVTGTCTSMINERYFRWDLKHVLNSGWPLFHTVIFVAGANPSGCSCAPGHGFNNSIRFTTGAYSGKRKILIERRITYNDGCDPITIEGEFNPTLPECSEVPSGLGFSITPPSGGFLGYVRCSGTASGSVTDRIYVYEQPYGTGGYSYDTYDCGDPNGSDNDLDANNSYLFFRIITFADCPPIFLTHDYQAPTTCTTATITCTRDNANGRAKATRVNHPANLASDYLEYRRGAGSWFSYSEGQWIYVTGTTSVSFRRVANYNNGCSQTTDSCSTTVTPPTHSLSISCVSNQIVVSASGMPSGGTYFYYRDGFAIGSNSSPVTFPTDQAGTWQVKYKYNQYQEIVSNSVSCGTSGGCTDPTVSLGACNINGNVISIPFTTTGITSIGQISANVDPGSGSFSWNAGTGTLSVTGTPGVTYDFDVTVTNDCDTDVAYRTCSIGCSVLTIEQGECDFTLSRTYFSVYVSPDTGQAPLVAGATYLGKTGNKYNFYQSGTSGTITADHSQACDEVEHTISCSCADPIITHTATCSLNSISYSFAVTNEQNAGNYLVKVAGATVATITNTGAGTYTGSYSVAQGSTNSFQITTDNSCGGTESSTLTNVTCGCNDPNISLSASCDTSSISYSFVVSNEAQVTSNYSVKVNGSTVATKVKTGAGLYSGTYAVTAGSNNTVQIVADSQCGGTVNSSIVGANCGCPSSSLSIDNVICNSSTQVLTFTINDTNLTGLVLTVNGNTETITSNPQSVQGIPGVNTILVTGDDSCASTTLSESRTINCSCTEPSISLSTSCNTSGTISYSFVVTNEARTDGDYSLLINGSDVATISNTSAGTYSGTYSGTAGNTYTVQIEVPNLCGEDTLSNQTSTNCNCPAASVAIVSPACNSTNQSVSFTVSTTNSTVTAKYLNGTLITGSGPWTGVVGTNTITVNATDNCSGELLTDTETLTCGCTLLPTVQIDTMTEASGVLTVKYTTANITSTGQITFKGNGVTRPVVADGTNKWKSTFSLNEGSNSVLVTVLNACGTASDNDSYSYSTCVAPSLTKVTEQCGDGYLYVYTNAQNITHADIDTTPSSVRYGTGNNLTFRFAYGAGDTINWDIDGETDCGTVGISGTSQICPEVTIDISNGGCSGSGTADYIFLVDNSGSIDNGEFFSMRDTVKATVDEIAASSIDWRIALVQYIDDESYTTLSYTTNTTNLGSWSRHYSTGNDFLNDVLADVITKMGSSLSPRAGAVKHLVIFSDAVDNDLLSSRITPLTNRNTISSNGWIISYVKYRNEPHDTNDNAIAKSAANASVGGSYQGAVYANYGDPEGNQSKPRRLYIKNSFDGNAVPGLTDNIAQNSCSLTAFINGCQSSGTFSWVASGGGSITAGASTSTITTNGTGTYTVTVDTGNCEVEEDYTY